MGIGDVVLGSRYVPVIYKFRTYSLYVSVVHYAFSAPGIRFTVDVPAYDKSVGDAPL